MTPTSTSPSADPARRRFLDRLSIGLIGPGSERLWPDKDSEIISDFPVRRYFGGILFPKRAALRESFGEQTQLRDQIGESVLDIEGEETDEALPVFEKEVEEEKGQEIPQNPVVGQEYEATETGRVSANYYYPTNLGLSFCVARETTHLQVAFSFGYYKKLTKTERALFLAQADYERLAELAQLTAHPIEELITYSDGTLRLTPEGAKETLSQLRIKYKGQEELLNSEGYQRVGTLLSDSLWQRVPVEEVIDIQLPNANDTFSGKLWELEISESLTLKACYHARIILREGRKYVKLLLENDSTDHPGSKFSNANDSLNRKCFFQASIGVQGTEILPYKPHQARNPYDSEAETIGYQYREVKSYGIGHSCSVNWGHEIPMLGITTTHLPQVDIKHYSNDFRCGITSEVREITKLRNLSIWTPLNQEVVQQRLHEFVDSYGQWLEEQRTKARQKPTHARLYDPILAAHDAMIARLRQNIEALADKRIYRCFHGGQICPVAAY